MRPLILSLLAGTLLAGCSGTPAATGTQTNPGGVGGSATFKYKGTDYTLNASGSVTPVAGAQANNVIVLGFGNASMNFFGPISNLKAGETYQCTNGSAGGTCGLTITVGGGTVNVPTWTLTVQSINVTGSSVKLQGTITGTAEDSQAVTATLNL